MIYLSRADLESISSRVLRAYWKLPQAQENPLRVNPDILLTALLGLSIDYRHLSKDRLTLGLTSFDDIGVEVFDGQPDEMYYLDGRTVLIETDLQLEDACVGRRNFTVAHEGSHHILNMLFPGVYSHGLNARRVLKYRLTGSRGEDWEEWQMDALSSALLMPADLLRNNMKLFGLDRRIDVLNQVWRRQEYESFTAVSDIMGVSKQALAYRMQRLGLMGENQLMHPNKLIDVWRDDDE